MLQNIGATIYIVFGVFFPLATFTVLLRIYVRTRLIKKFGLDDWTAVFGWLIFASFTAIIFAAVQYAFNPVHGYPMVKLMKLIFASSPMYLVSGMLVKSSIAAMLLRIATIQQICRQIVITAVILYEFVSFIVLVAVFFQCWPVSYYWGQLRGDPGRCAPLPVRTGFIYLLAATTCLTDWVFAVVPFLLIRKMVSINKRTKTMLAIVMSMGSIASVATIVRMAYIHGGFTDTSTKFLIWTYIELALAITASSAATLKPLIVRISPESRNESTLVNLPSIAKRSDPQLSLDSSYFDNQETILKTASLEMSHLEGSQADGSSHRTHESV